MSLMRDLQAAIDAIERLPAGVEAAAANHILDITGVAVAAACGENGAAWLRYGEGVIRHDGESTLIGTEWAAPAAEAALVNGGLMHSLEYDDTHTGAIAHGSSVLASTALAVGEAEGNSGREVLHAYAVWYEVLIRLGLSSAGDFQKRGFQLTSVGGALCAAGIAAMLKRLDKNGIAMAVGIALSQASGVFAFLSNGATVKSMHPGWAAHCGIKAAELAKAGITGPDKPFEDTFGLFRVFAGDAEASGRFKAHVADLGERWHLPDVAFKFLPCCHYIHPFVEAAADLSKDGLRSDEIESLHFHVPGGAAPIICEPWEEKCRAAGHSARWSLPVVTAMQLVQGRVDLASFEAEAPAEVYALAARSTWGPLKDSGFPRRFDAALEIASHNGETRLLRIDDVYGNASRPPSKEAILDKFRRNMRGFMDDDAILGLADALNGIGTLPDLSNLGELLRNTAAKEAKNEL